MRLDRTISMIIASRRRRRSGGNGRDGKIPILMYHSISLGETGGAHAYYETSTSPSLFRRHMEILRELRYCVVRLRDVSDSLFQKPLNGLRRAIITFDDGYLDFYENAFPVLRSFGFPATMFVPTAFIGAAGPGIEGKFHLSWKHVREMHADGIDFGSHTINHPQLAELPEGEILRQVKESKETIEHNTGAPVDTFAYPFAFPENRRKWVEVLRRLLVETGYHAGVCTSIGRAAAEDDRLFLKRLPVNTFDDEAFFKAKLDGAYDWLHGPQLFVKRLKNVL